ncbi:MAG: hypothetical protein KDK89_20945 [Alphaproteobacteria bacterium]|nr:hypothetical protein [Alphaproteobacteria bacterium]
MSTQTKQATTVDESRHNFYYIIHKGLRLGHCRLLAMISATDFTNPSDCAMTIAAVRDFLMLARSHLEGENREIHAALEARAPGASAHAADDHDDHERSFAELEALLRKIEAAPASAKARAGKALYRRYAIFAAHDMEHMNEEETALLAALHAAFTDAELHEIEGRIVAAIAPAKMAAYLNLMMPALSHPERVDMLGHMRQAMPPAVFDSVLHGAVRPALEADEFAAAVSALGLSEAA